MPADTPGIPGLLSAAAQAGHGLPALSPSACAAALGLDGLTLCVLDRSGLELVWYDPADIVGIAFEDLQFTLGEGPTLDVARTGEPVLVPDLQALPGHRWPALLAALHRKLPRVAYSVPLSLGAIRLGVLNGHRSTPGLPTRSQLGQLFALAEGVTAILTTPDGIHDMGTNNPIPLHRAVIHQATGALTVLLDIPIDQALARLRAYAFTHNLALLDVAHAVVHHQDTLDKPPG
ncbi:GAF and ANTAR domain-containing protein [Streptomyces kanamyceticus]|uniref:GAF and ANTAR domain-containing protein n=1 Tax=Streptomyces kanamyceticus TaxID=1967 RepID=UPI0006E2917A|nr:GAF and ANTAR domain-containing protein [Streptomyces kanamyceticus]